MDSVYENLVRHFGNIDSSGEKPLSEQIATLEQCEKFDKDIAKLEAKMRRENNPRKKFDIRLQINKLNELKESYTNG